MIRLHRMGSSGPFGEIYFGEVRSHGMLDPRKAVDMVMHSLYEDSYMRMPMRGRDSIIVIVNNVDVSHGLMAASARMCDGSCETLKQKTVFNEKEIKKQIAKIEDADKILLLL